ncbi:flavonol 4'-sulfotransferase-like [Typha latifolia]|uniref:flavonol 4'-sulfotransferase-like n=1 Tax=Typha latifolia TaxID=4733 RepID=UPI003C2BC3D0
MATGPIPFKSSNNEEEDVKPSPPHDYDELVSTLPLNEGLRLYQNFWWPESVVPGIIQIQQHFHARPTDVFLATFPKSGTTWLKALIFTIMTRTQSPLAQNPILSHHPHDCVIFMDELFASGHGHKLEPMPSPRILHTHMAYSLLPASVRDDDLGCRIIYLCRDPKDTVVSMWRFVEKSNHEKAKEFPFDKLCDMFCEGTSPAGPIWDHVLQYWRESLRRPEKVLFLKYEEMLENTVEIVKMLGEFLGCPFSEEEEREGVVEEVVRICSFENLKGLKVNKVGSQGSFWKFSNSSYFRKGGVGDWKNHMSMEMAKKMDEVMRGKIKGSGLILPTLN